ncbi:MAG TPA: alpha/beta hydrolase [Jatrophihabitantaceae bacterium]
MLFGSLAPARRRLVLAVGAVIAIGAVVGGVAVAVSGGGGSTESPVAQDRTGPVLLVPGYGGSVTGLDQLAARLRSGDRTVEVVPLPDQAQGDLGAQARALDRAVRAETAKTGATSVDVVGYSAGGVVARLWVRSYGGADRARRVITLGSPHHGTEIAALGSLFPGDVCPTACQQLAPDSQLLANLNSGDETPAGPAFVSIWSTDDQVVVPPDSARLAGALDVTVQSVCAGAKVSHSDLPTNPVVDGMVAAELAAGPPVALSAADCARFSAGR